MPELLLELLSEEIPARMQVRGAEDLARLVAEALAALAPREMRRFSGPRRIAVAAEVATGVAESRQSERGPRIAAPEQAMAGFLRKHGATREQLREEGAFWVLDRAMPRIDAAALIAREMPGLLRRFPWPKSMRWGGGSAFAWVRPLRRILCILDGAVVRFDLRQGEDDGHGLASDNLSEGHRFMAPGAFVATSAAQWQSELRARCVIADAAERRAAVESGIAAAAGTRGLSVVEDAGLLDEVAGLVEWPVALLGRIDPAYMDLPPEAMQVSMRVNQRYFALRDAAGGAAPWFAFAANVAADDGGAAIVAGNERVLRARFSDARHFWDLDRKTKLIDRVPALDAITFHAKLGSQGDRVRRLVRIAGEIAPLVGADPKQAARAAELAKADLTTGMVAEFPELQGIMGGYYARWDGEEEAIAHAIRDHYLPRGAGDLLPEGLLSIAVAISDKLDLLVSFFAIEEKPTGSGDPFGLRRAAIGIIRILRESDIGAGLRLLIELAGGASVRDQLFTFIIDERLRAQMRAEGTRYDLISAILDLGYDDIAGIFKRARALGLRLQTDEGTKLLVGYRRAANILRAENAKDGPHQGAVADSLFQTNEEQILWHEFEKRRGRVEQSLRQASVEAYLHATDQLAQLGPPLDRFFEHVTVNSPQPALRTNRLRLLASVVSLMNQVADFSKIEG